MATEEPRTVIVERSGGSMTAIIAIIALLIVAVGGYMLLTQNDRKDDAITKAVGQAGDAAQDVGEAAKDAAKKQP